MRLWPDWKYYHGICLEGSKKATNILSQCSRSPGRGLNPEHPTHVKHECRKSVLNLVRMRGVNFYVQCKQRRECVLVLSHYGSVAAD
jgi:hypothetical protein